MKYGIIGTVLLLGLAACGASQGNVKQILTDKCISEGDGDEVQCACMADQATKTLAPDMLDMIVAAAGSENSDEYMASKMAEVKPEDIQSMMLFMNAAISECGLELN